MSFCSTFSSCLTLVSSSGVSRGVSVRLIHSSQELFQETHRPAFRTGKSSSERFLRVRDFERPRSSLGKKHKYQLPPKAETPESFYQHDPGFQKVATFEGMMLSLSQRGFRRPYKSYTPPADLDEVFVATCAKTLPELSTGADLSKIRLEGDNKARVLNALSKAVGGHDVPNSLVHTIDSLDKALTFYSTPVDSATSYERMAAAQSRGELPPNLHVQVDPLRFNPEQALAQGRTGLLNTVTAYPKSSTILSTPEARKRYGENGGYKAKGSPYINVPERNKD